MPPDFEELLSVLNAHQVRYLIVGGYAVSFHAAPRGSIEGSQRRARESWQNMREQSPVKAPGSGNKAGNRDYSLERDLDGPSHEPDADEDV
jgi:hypothetical protein